nr:3-hydroxybenzoate 6-hydroxylase 1 [Quercus suber]
MAPKQVHDLHVTIIGAGMGGLTTALALAKKGFTNIHVYEYASNLGFVGAGIQLAPNMARILDRLGVWEDIEKEAVDLKSTSIRRERTRATSPSRHSANLFYFKEVHQMRN